MTETKTYSYDDSSAGMGQLSEVGDTTTSSTLTPPPGMPAFITLTAAESPTGSAITLYWTNAASPPDGAPFGGGYVSDPTYDWGGSPLNEEPEVAIVSPTFLTEGWETVLPASDWGLVAFSAGQTSEMLEIYTLSGLTFSDDPLNAVNVQVGDDYANLTLPSTIALTEDSSDLTTSSSTFTTDYTYDPVTHQQASITTTESGGSPNTIHYVYDDATGLLTETWTGSNHTTAQNDILYGYDAQGRLESVSQVRLNSSNQTGSSQTRYSANGTAITTTDPTTLYTYDGNGNVLTVSDPSGMLTTYTYNNIDELTEEVVTNTNSNKTLFDETITWDNNGLKAQTVDKRYLANGTLYSQFTTAWTYDGLNRLVGMKKVPDHNTLCRAHKNLVKPGVVEKMLDVSIAMGRGLHRRNKKKKSSMRAGSKGKVKAANPGTTQAAHDAMVRTDWTSETFVPANSNLSSCV